MQSNPSTQTLLPTLRLSPSPSPRARGEHEYEKLLPLLALNRSKNKNRNLYYNNPRIRAPAIRYLCVLPQTPTPCASHSTVANWSLDALDNVSSIYTFRILSVKLVHVLLFWRCPRRFWSSSVSVPGTASKAQERRRTGSTRKTYTTSRRPHPCALLRRVADPPATVPKYPSSKCATFPSAPTSTL